MTRFDLHDKIVSLIEEYEIATGKSVGVELLYDGCGNYNDVWEYDQGEIYHRGLCEVFLLSKGRKYPPHYPQSF